MSLSLIRRHQDLAIAIVHLTGAALMPFFFSEAAPFIDDSVTALAYVVMALGLNIVVGYAGLLDLGYVAFYAMGAYTAAWFASQHFHGNSIHIGSVGVNPDAAGIHISIWILLFIAAIFTAIVGVIIGFPTLRLRGDYLAIVTLGFGEIMPQIARNGDNLFGHNITNGPQGINPIDPPGFGETLNDACEQIPRILRIGLPDRFVEHAERGELFASLGLDMAGLCGRVRRALGRAEEVELAARSRS